MRRGAGREVCAFQDDVPGLAAIGRLIETAVRRIAPERARHRRKDRVAVGRTHDDFCDAFRVGQTDMGPGLAAIAGFVDSVADRNAVARPRFARPDPDVLRVLGIERDRADRLHRLLVEDRLVTRPAILGFPNAAAGRADEERDFAGRFPEWRQERRCGRSWWRSRCCARRDRKWWRNCRAPARRRWPHPPKQSAVKRMRFGKAHKDYLEVAVGNLNAASSTGTFASAFSMMIFCLSVDPLGPASIENGKNTPAIFS